MNQLKALLTQKASINKSIRSDVCTELFEFETQAVNKMFRIPESTNLAEEMTKKNNPLTEPLV